MRARLSLCIVGTGREFPYLVSRDAANTEPRVRYSPRETIWAAKAAVRSASTHAGVPFALPRG